MDMKKELRRLVEEELNARIERVLAATKDAANYESIQPMDLLRLAQGGKNASLRKKVISAMVKAKEEDMYKQFFGGESRVGGPETAASYVIPAAKEKKAASK
jgi:hypothetical protein